MTENTQNTDTPKSEKTEASEKSEQAARIVRAHMLGSLVSGVVPIPLLNIPVLGAIQLRMLEKLAGHYDVKFSEQLANAIIGSLVGSSLSLTAVSLVGALPGIGKLLGSVGKFAFPVASTYALGHVFIQHFESGGTFLTFDADRAKKDYDEKLEEGRRVAAEECFAGVKP